MLDLDRQMTIVLGRAGIPAETNSIGMQAPDVSAWLAVGSLELCSQFFTATVASAGCATNLARQRVPDE